MYSVIIDHIHHLQAKYQEICASLHPIAWSDSRIHMLLSMVEALFFGQLLFHYIRGKDSEHVCRAFRYIHNLKFHLSIR